SCSASREFRENSARTSFLFRCAFPAFLSAIDRRARLMRRAVYRRTRPNQIDSRAKATISPGPPQNPRPTSHEKFDATAQPRAPNFAANRPAESETHTRRQCANCFGVWSAGDPLVATRKKPGERSGRLYGTRVTQLTERCGR